MDWLTWDVVTDANGNIAVASDPYSVSQDVGSALKLVYGELWYQTNKGVPYFTQILGRAPPIAFMKQKFITAALTVPEVVSAVCFIDSIIGRKVQGQVQATTNTGITLPVALP